MQKEIPDSTIQDYLDKKLSGEMLNSFEERLRNDPQLAEEIDSIRNLELGPRELRCRSVAE